VRRAILLGLCLTAVVPSTTAAARGCSPQRAAAQVTIRGYCFVGTDRPDRITGTSLGEIVYGWAGADRIDGRAGDDRLYAGAEDDIVHGGPGTDVIDPGLGRDHVYGGAGNDTLKTRGGERDWVSCGSGFDVAYVDKQDVLARDCEKVLVARGYA
jgi:Ca2+-binding RTX toxin-like protein